MQLIYGISKDCLQIRIAALPGPAEEVCGRAGPQPASYP